MKQLTPGLLALSILSLAMVGCGGGGECGTEAACYEIVTVPIPDSVALEVGGLAPVGDRLAVATRRGEVWWLDGIYDRDAVPRYTRFASGLHEPLGLLWHDDALLTAQRGELTRLTDQDGDDRADRYETVRRFPLSGNYHEYNYGPKLAPDGNLMVTLNLAWVGYGASPVPWRGWAVKVTPDGELRPFATGMRSPAGFGFNAAGDLFYAENQGDWIGSGYITHVDEGDFGGHPNGLAWATEPTSPVRLTKADIPDTGRPRHEVGLGLPGFKLPTVWFPHTIMGISTSDILLDTEEGRLGPFDGHLYVGDQGHSKVMRVALDEVNGVYQGAVFPFREGFSSGILRLVWGADGSMLVGMTSRGWASTGPEPYGLQRLVWTGQTPVEMHSIRAQPDGLEIRFTTPMDAEALADPATYAITSFTYQYHERYGSPIIDTQPATVRAAEVGDDGRTVRLAIDRLRQYYIHEIRLDSTLRSQRGTPLLHDVAYYTLNEIPGGGAAPVASSGEASAIAAGTASEKSVTTMPEDWNGEADETLVLGTLPGLKFDKTLLDVEAGSRVALRFENADDMLHNVVITLPGAVDAVAEAALNLGLTGEAQQYVPPRDDVLFHTSLLQPETEETIYFTAPEEPGEYPFVCTFPGHAYTMRGILTVTAPDA